jgi:uracil-DNA glycosylase
MVSAPPVGELSADWKYSWSHNLKGQQIISGIGSPQALVMMISEQPGDKKVLLGRPFVGPAGAVLDRPLVAANLSIHSSPRLAPTPSPLLRPTMPVPRRHVLRLRAA